MSNDGSEKPGSSTESRDVDRSATSGRVTVEQSAHGHGSISVRTPVQTVSSSQDDDLSSLHAISVGAVRNYSGIWQVPTSGRHGVSSTEASTSTSAFVPSATRGFNLSFPSQATDDDDDDSNDDKVFSYVRYRTNSHLRQTDERSHALLISGGDVTNVNFARACLNDVNVVQKILTGPNGTIPENNVYRITPNENQTEGEIENICSHVTTNRPLRLLFYYSGHGVSLETGHPHLHVSNQQGNALTISRVKTFIDSLMPDCRELLLILDCCSAGDHILLSMLPDNRMPRRIHVQWSSCQRGGTSYIQGNHSVFSHNLISAMMGATTCADGNENCPLCLKFRRSIRQDGYVTLEDFWECLLDHMTHNHNHFSPPDLPIFDVLV